MARRLSRAIAIREVSLPLVFCDLALRAFNVDGASQRHGDAVIVIVAWKVFSGKRADAPEDVERLREEFRRRKDEVFGDLLQNAEVRALVEVIYDSSNREAQYFLKQPSLSWLKENPQLVLETISVLSSQDAPFVGRLGDAIEKYGVEAVSDIVLELFNQISYLTRQLGLGDSLTDGLEYGWELGSPLSSRPRHTRRQNQLLWTGRSSLTFPVPSHCQRDGPDKLDRCMDEPLPVSTSPRDDNDVVNGCEQYDRRNSVKQSASTVGKSSAGEAENNRMRVLIPPAPRIAQAASDEAPKLVAADGDFRETPGVSSRGHSSRRSMSCGGSELYTSDSDDDSFSTSSQMSLLVAVSESHSSGSSSADDLASESGRNEARVVPEDNSEGCTGTGKTGMEEAGAAPAHDFPAFKPEIQIQDGGEEYLDKLPIYSSVVLSSKSSGSENEKDLSFYAPEMWTYSEKEGHDLDGTEASRRNAPEQQASNDTSEHEEELMEEVKVVIVPSVEDKYVSVSVQPVTIDSWRNESGGAQVQDDLFAVKRMENPVSEEVKDDTENLEENGGKLQGGILVAKTLQAPGSGELAADSEFQLEKFKEATSNSGDEDLAAASLSKAIERDELGGAGEKNSQDVDKNYDDARNGEQVVDDVHLNSSSVDGNGDLEKQADVKESSLLAEDHQASEALHSEDDGLPPPENSRSSADYLERLREEDGPEIAATQKSEPPKAPDSPPKPESLLVPYSGLIALSGPIAYPSSHSGTVPYSGSLSLRSDSSTNSTRSFAFPVLSSEWNSSPVKMAPPERNYMHHRRRSWRSLCCFCPTPGYSAD
ncbi:uncharacterized protein LOC9630144 [Selaginella moellendorffii]|uniref:uncharacterized protein LOC9630144 n=1 Tax=Selaginella moellendorffii TaxID=88036 RepID=UPI000D1CB5FA|nr:uncharacterized protein LOC9630144 [Selaginella moellendorffii]|eukprot:XP_024536040.1 uncharacterized protein LOC9630144 [Selaginella moellendorffii]